MNAVASPAVVGGYEWEQAVTNALARVRIRAGLSSGDIAARSGLDVAAVAALANFPFAEQRGERSLADLVRYVTACGATLHEVTESIDALLGLSRPEPPYVGQGVVAALCAGKRARRRGWAPNEHWRFDVDGFLVNQHGNAVAVRRHDIAADDWELGV